MVTERDTTAVRVPIYAFFMTTIRVEIDLAEQSVTEVVVDEGTMEVPTLIVDSDGFPVTAETKAAARWIADPAEWPSWDYGSARQPPAVR